MARSGSAGRLPPQVDMPLGSPMNKLRSIPDHALVLADFLTPVTVEGPSRIVFEGGAAANLLLTLSSIHFVSARLVIPWDDPGMCGIPVEEDRVDALTHVLLTSIQLQYAWAALEQLLPSLPRLPGEAHMQTEERVVRRIPAGLDLEHADCAARRLIRFTPELFRVSKLAPPSLGGTADDSYQSSAGLRCARLVRNKIIHGRIAEIATGDFDGRSELQALVCSNAARAALFAVQYLALALTDSSSELPEGGAFVLRRGPACSGTRHRRSSHFAPPERRVNAREYLQVAHLKRDLDPTGS